MIDIHRHAGGPDALVWTEPPCIYFDTWALTKFAKEAAYRTKFLQLFKDRGTLVFSLMNVGEIGLYKRPNWPDMRAFLEKVGPYWFPLTIDPLAVIERQEAGNNPPDAYASVQFLQDPQFAALLLAGDLTLVHVVDLTRGPAGDDLRNVTAARIDEVRASLDRHRQAYLKDLKELNAKWPVVKFDPDKPMRQIYNAFIRLCVTDTFKLTDHHCRDLFHSITAVGCGQMVLLDGHWAEQARKVLHLLEMPADLRIYDPSQVFHFLSDLAAHPASRGLHRPPI